MFNTTYISYTDEKVVHVYIDFGHASNIDDQKMIVFTKAQLELSCRSISRYKLSCCSFLNAWQHYFKIHLILSNSFSKWIAFKVHLRRIRKALFALQIIIVLLNWNCSRKLSLMVLCLQYKWITSLTLWISTTHICVINGRALCTTCDVINLNVIRYSW